MQVPASEIYNTALSFILEGNALNHLFPVRTDMAERVQAMFDVVCSDPAGQKKFALFDTTNGWTVAVRLDKVEAMRILSNPIQDDLEYEPAEPGLVRFHFGAEREPLELLPVQAEEVAVLSTELDTGLELTPRRFISLIDEDEEELYIGMTHVLLVEMDTARIEEGIRSIDKTMDALPEDGEI
jgi:hypothetical protein